MVPVSWANLSITRTEYHFGAEPNFVFALEAHQTKRLFLSWRVCENLEYEKIEIL